MFCSMLNILHSMRSDIHIRFHFGYDLNVPVSIGVHWIALHKKCRLCANSWYHILKQKPHKKCKRLFYYVKLLPHECIVFSLTSDRTQIPFQVSLLKSESNEPNTNVPNIGLLLSRASISTIHAKSFDAKWMWYEYTIYQMKHQVLAHNRNMFILLSMLNFQLI